MYNASFVLLSLSIGAPYAAGNFSATVSNILMAMLTFIFKILNHFTRPKAHRFHANKVSSASGPLPKSGRHFCLHTLCELLNSDVITEFGSRHFPKMNMST